MNCPEHKVFNVGGFWVWMYWQDVPRERIPLRIWLNPLRYELTLVVRGRRWFRINPRGRAAYWWANLMFRMKEKQP
jgi:hypothetical protein